MEFMIRWCQCPHVEHASKTVFVEAENEANAEEVARDHITRKIRTGWFTIFEVTPYLRPAPGLGRVLVG